MRILLVEDDAELRGAVERRLRSSGFAVDTVADLPEASWAPEVNDYDCLVLDRIVPSGDTIDLLSSLRADSHTVPALFLTARDSVEDRVAGFEAGGDDYLVKPFSMDELVVRVRALCRRAGTSSPAIVQIGDLEVDQARARVRRAEVLLSLTAKELCVLQVLAINVGNVVSRTELIEHCWDELTDPMSNTVDVHIASVRRKLGDPPMIETVRGLGYRLDEPGAIF